MRFTQQKNTILLHNQMTKLNFLQIQRLPSLKKKKNEETLILT